MERWHPGEAHGHHVAGLVAAEFSALGLMPHLTSLVIRVQNQLRVARRLGVFQSSHEGVGPVSSFLFLEEWAPRFDCVWQRVKSSNVFGCVLSIFDFVNKVKVQVF